MTLSIELQPLDGKWVTLGSQTQGGAGFLPGSIEYSGDLNEYGCLDASFKLKMNPRWPRDIIERFTPVVIKDGSDDVWSGRIIAAPSTYAEDAEITVQCQGWGQHTKDDCTDREWVISDMSRWVDSRTMPDIDLARHKPFNGTIENTGNVITMTIPNATIVPSDCHFFVCLDMGPNNLAKVVYADLECSANDASAGFYTANDSNASGTFDESTNEGACNFSSAFISRTFTTARRYVFLGYYRSSSGTYGADFYLRLKNIRVYTDSADQSTGASILPASTIIGETLTSICPLISSDQSKIATTATYFPNFPGSPGYKYANELIDQANSIHGYRFRLSPNPVPVAEFAPLPTDYSFVVGAGEYTLLDPSSEDGRGVYSRVISEYEDAAGIRAGATAVGDATKLDAVQPTNPSFDTDTSGWATSGTFTRDTGVFNSTPASARLNGSFAGAGYFAGAYTTISGLTPGKAYKLQFQFYRAATLISGTAINVYRNPGSTADLLLEDTTSLQASALSAWQYQSISFYGPADGIAIVGVTLGQAGAGILGYIDSFELLSGTNSIVERRGFIRTALRPHGIKTTAATAQALADLEYDNSQFPPFKGTIGIEGRIRTKGGATIPVSHLPHRVGEALLIENLTDPNTGALGRQGIIQSAKYNRAQNRAEVTIDSAQNFLTQLKQRLALGVR